MSTPYPPHPYPYPQQQPPGPYPYQQPPGPGCEVCGAMPAAPVTVRGHQGMVVVMRFLRRQGVLCRTCGLAVARKMQADTLVQGWWGPLSMLITPFVLLLNLGELSRIRKLPPPATAAWRPPLDPGRPLLRRPAGLVALVPLLALAGLVLAVPVLFVIGMAVDSRGSGHPTLTPGSCARNVADWPEQDLRPADCGSPDAEFRVYWPDGPSCGPGDYDAYPEYSRNGDLSLCLHPVKN
ncbi:hypothetical protein [Streptomyces sp. NPDC005890]|uniref:LppU/SCO3897 family protein n=1 Tax=Streptomyces sp. NPDC005890 TaxID=3154568 RepID=UPI0033F43D10